MSDSSKTVSITAEIPEDLLKTLENLARQRGVSANTVLSQAIRTEKFFPDTEASGSRLLAQGRDNRLQLLTPKNNPADNGGSSP